MGGGVTRYSVCAVTATCWVKLSPESGAYEEEAPNATSCLKLLM